MTKQVSFRLRNALVIAVISGDSRSYKAIVNGSVIPLSYGQYSNARKQAKLPAELSFSRN